MSLIPMAVTSMGSVTVVFIGLVAVTSVGSVTVVFIGLVAVTSTGSVTGKWLDFSTLADTRQEHRLFGGHL